MGNLLGHLPRVFQRSETPLFSAPPASDGASTLPNTLSRSPKAAKNAPSKGTLNESLANSLNIGVSHRQDPPPTPFLSPGKEPEIISRLSVSSRDDSEKSRVSSVSPRMSKLKEFAPSVATAEEEEDVPIDEKVLNRFKIDGKPKPSILIEESPKRTSSNDDKVMGKVEGPHLVLPGNPADNEGLSPMVAVKSRMPSSSEWGNSAPPTSLSGMKKQMDVMASRQSQSSLGTSGFMREITETWSTIIKQMKWSLLSVALNGGLLGLLHTAEKGVVLNLSDVFVNQFGGIILLVVLLISNSVTIWSLNESASCLLGYMLSSHSGFSFVACGFMHVPPLRKMQFAQSLSLTSKYRKILSRAAFLWIVVELLKVLTPISAISLMAAKYAFYNDVSDCIYFVQDKDLKPIDRKWPTLDTEGGVAEYVFGSSIGYLRSEMNVNKTTAMFAPTLISALNNGDTIQGLGFSVDIYTTCKCAADISTSAIIAAGVDPSQANETLDKFLSLTKRQGLTFGVVNKNTSLVISNLFSGYNLCGGNVITKWLPLVCSTTMNNHQAMMMEMMFMTDGTTASIAPDIVTPLYTVGQADINTWLSFAMNAITNGPVSSYLTPATVPGSLAPILWWTTPNLIAIDRAIVETGIETMYAILFKAAIQRTYTAKGMQCPRKNLISSYQSTVSLRSSGFVVSSVLLSIQMAIAICSMLVFSVWFLSKSPIGPAVRATQEPIYLITLLASSNNVGLGLNDLCNAETYAIWQRLDVKCRIGESISTLDQETGKIIVDKPSLVRTLENGRKYC
ncbi:hypothetical protein BCR33DRAFT_720495 [Rhizoclosmatium globosum]|uniref:Uncharacterized protein n=1 Tax=Rhizoclosmatium globosum TaxID=329046 RepID=A0A1Y2BVR5_9FUNG|nr:hypothetical protein BCR33DRAFT_720495 [Rhizoclosmatium globosum]|eukprot:ORY38823.1 hypothetical protein BCR33DRAFT_720495 [Rhizoclosmatium globosum]